MATVSDRKLANGDFLEFGDVSYYDADVLSHSEYYPYGMTMPGRSGTDGSSYRYGFNGMEQDDEVKGDGNSLDYNARFYDPRIGRWEAKDPHSANYPYLSPYAYVANKPTIYVDKNGKDHIYFDINGEVVKVVPSAEWTFHMIDEYVVWEKMCYLVDVSGKANGTAVQVGTLYQDVYDLEYNDPFVKNFMLQSENISSLSETVDYYHKIGNHAAAKSLSEMWGQNTIYKGHKAFLEDPLGKAFIIAVFAIPAMGILGEQLIAEEALEYAIEEVTGIPIILDPADVIEFFGKKGYKKILKYIANNKPCGCFTEGTDVLTEDGYKPIEEIEVGDLVWAYDDSTGVVTLKEVTNTFVLEWEEIYQIYTNGELIEATHEHPFFIGGKWVRVDELSVGDTLTLYDGSYSIIDSIKTETGQFTVYNFEVEDFHSYYISPWKILVHNGKPCRWDLIPWSSAGLRRTAKEIYDGATDVFVKNKAQAEELFLGLYQGKGFKNTTGMNATETKQFYGSKNGTYHWDLTPDPNSVHNTPHLQIHDENGTVIRIFFDN